jgi:GNAT superfamily N-acetyltransferase
VLAQLQERIWRGKYHGNPAIAEFLNDADLANAWKDVLSSQDHAIFLAYGEHGEVGYLLASRDDAIAEIESLEIDQAHTRRGHASRLMSAFIDTMAPATSAIMWCDPADEATRRFLTSCGWGPDGSFRTIADDDGRMMNQVRFACEIP